MSRLILLAVIAAGSGTIYQATEVYCTTSADTPANTLFAGRLVDTIYERGVSFPAWNRAGGAQAISYLDLVNVDGGLDSWLTLDWKDVRITLRVVEPRAAYSTATQVGICVVERIEATSRDRIRFVCRSVFERLEKVVTQNYPDSISNEALRGKPRPITLGRVRWLDPLNKTLNDSAGATRAAYEVADDYFEDITQLLEKGTALTESPDPAVVAAGEDFFLIHETEGYGFRFHEQDGRLAADVQGQIRRDSTQMFTNASIATSGLGWSIVQNGTSTVVFGSSDATLTGNADIARLYQTLTTVAGALYHVEADIDNTTGAGVDFIAGGSAIRTVDGITVRTISAFFTAAGTSTVVGLEIPASRTATAKVTRMTCNRAYRINTLSEIVRFCGATRGSLSTSDIDDTAIAAIDTALGYAIGWTSNGAEVRGIDLVTLAAQSFGTAIFQDANGKLAPVQIAEPAVSADFTLDELSIVDIGYEADTAPGLSTRMHYGRNYAPHSDDDVAGLTPATTAAAALLVQELRAEVRSVTTTETLDALYVDAISREPMDSLLSEETDAQAEIDRLCALYTQPRAFYTVKAFVDSGTTHTIEPGHTVAVTHSRYGLSAGVNLLVVAARSDFLGNSVDLVLWG